MAATFKYEISNLLNSLTCPVTLNPMTDAVTLMPCCHKISEAAATSMFKGVQKGSFFEVEKTTGLWSYFGCKNTGLCPYCKTPVTGYGIDRTIREFAKVLLVDQKLTLTTKEVEAEKKELPIPFPGKRAKFYATTDWNDKKLLFFKTNDDALIQTVYVKEEENGAIQLGCFIEGEKNRHSFSDYHKKLGVEDQFLGYICGTFRFEGEDCKIIFEDLARHNTFPCDEYELITSLFESGNWKAAAIKKTNAEENKN